MRWRWPIVACGLVAALAATIAVGYRIGLAQNEGFMNIGINYEYTAKWALMTYLPKFAVAMGIGLLLVKRAQQQIVATEGGSSYERFELSP